MILKSTKNYCLMIGMRLLKKLSFINVYFKKLGSDSFKNKEALMS